MILLEQNAAKAKEQLAARKADAEDAKQVKQKKSDEIQAQKDTLDAEVRRAGGGTRKVTLPGVPVVSGRALGALIRDRSPLSRT